MKRIVLLLTLFCLTTGMSLSASSDGNDFIPIRILDDTVVSGRTHRGSPEIPIQAYYDSATSTVSVSFSQNLGEIELIITNLLNGDYVTYIIETCQGSVILPFNGESGLYRLLFLPPTGPAYEGEFSLQ